MRRQAKSAADEQARIILSVEAGLTAGIIAFLACGVFLSVLYYPPLWILLGLFAALDRLAFRQASTA